MKIPEGNHTIAALINKAHEDWQEPPRYHLGCSVIGHKCERYIWLSFRWAFYPKFNGRILRLFRRGQLEEKTIVEDLRAIGCKVTAEENGEQIRVDFSSHLSGSIDAVIHEGLPGAEKTPHIVEMKTHSLKSFNDMQKNGVEKSKPQHFAQMQLYMLGLNIDRGLYYAVCKDNDEIYTERVELDRERAERFVAKGHRIALDQRMPAPMVGASKTWFECKFCDARELCWGDAQPESNCRTCKNCIPMATSEMGCTHWDSLIPNEHQRVGCDNYERHPDLIELVNVC